MTQDVHLKIIDVMFSGEGIERYESSLENLRSLYDSMDDGIRKDKLKGLIDNWDSELEQGSVVFDANQTRQLLSSGKISTRGKALSFGTAFATGGRLPVSGSNGYRYGSSSSSSSSSSGNSSSASDAAKEFEETIDWIEVAIDRLERAIDTLDLKASSTYRSWSERNKNLTSEISKVTQEINLQQQGYNRYLQQANSVGLSSDWATKVQNGLVDISTITDEDLADKISEYQSWLISGHGCKTYEWRNRTFFFNSI